MLDLPELLFATIALTAILIPVSMRVFSHRLLDHPNHRSSHSAPRSRAGGLAFGLSWFLLSALVLVMGPYSVSQDLAVWLFGSRGTGSVIAFSWFLLGAAIIWCNGILDDFFQVPARYRILLQALGVAAGILGPDTFRDNLHPALLVLVFLGLVYFINVINFMDGTDGLAASEGIFLLLAAFLFGYAGIPMQILAVTLGVFLFWNLPGAKLFMGDAGSNLIGFITGYVLLQIFLERPALAFLLPVFFTTDTTLTLLVRLFRKQPFYLAHREHAYQHLARRSGHSRLLALLWVGNLIVLILASLAGKALSSAWMTALVVSVHLILAFLLYRAGAGRPAQEI